MRIKKNVAVSESGFLFDPTSGESFSINPEGQEIIQYLKEGKSFMDISELMCSEYQIDPASFEKYFYDFISMLRQFHLLEEEEQANPG